VGAGEPSWNIGCGGGEELKLKGGRCPCPPCCGSVGDEGDS